MDKANSTSAFGSPVYEIVAGEVGNTKTLFAHADVLAKSTVLRAAVQGPFKEKEEQKLTWPHWTIGGAEKFLEWLYTGDYKCPYPTKAAIGGSTTSLAIVHLEWTKQKLIPPTDYANEAVGTKNQHAVKKAPAEGPLKGLQELHWNGLRPLEKLSQAEEFDKWSGHQLWSPSELDYQATFMAHAELYSMACHYMVDDLKNQAWQRLRAVLIRIGTPKADTPLIGNLMMLASYVYENTADADSDGEEPLRMLVSSFSALHFTAMRGDGFAASMLSGNEGDRKFVVSLMTKVGQRMSYLESPAACKKRSKEYRAFNKGQFAQASSGSLGCKQDRQNNKAQPLTQIQASILYILMVMRYLHKKSFEAYGFTSILFIYSSTSETPLGIPFHVKPCSSISLARISIAVFHDGRATIRSCHAWRLGNPLNFISAPTIKTTSSLSFQETNAKSANAPLEHSANTPRFIDVATNDRGDFLRVENVKPVNKPFRIVTLAKEIETNTIKLDKYLEENNLPKPSLDADTPLMQQLPPHIAVAQEALTAALDELYWLNQGPTETVVAKASAASVGLKTILCYNIHTLVPLDSSATFQELADKTGLPVKKLTRLLRHGMTDRLFSESEPGRVKHTPATKALAVVPWLVPWALVNMSEVAPAKMHMVDAVAKWPDSEEPEHTGFTLANNTSKPMFEVFEEKPERLSRFKDAMTFLHTSPGLQKSYVLNGFDWASLGNGLIVDVGGSHGLVSQEIAREFPSLSFVVQDLPNVIEDAKTKVPADLAGRVTFMAHDMFSEQPVTDADVYYFRWILHSWSDKYCIKILRSLIPALKAGARIMFSERCLEAPNILGSHEEKVNSFGEHKLDEADSWLIREWDIMMLALCNAQERDHDDWEELLQAADARFKLEEVRRTAGAKLAMIVARWDESA
ncbi:MAG: hypothetical protein LQ348_003646 [Seirophora lacunosa]|nr:MAG: hypothetical protein LQ348_003646 [Seirophora lacunosa]